MHLLVAPVGSLLGCTRVPWATEIEKNNSTLDVLKIDESIYSTLIYRLNIHLRNLIFQPNIT